MRKDGGSLDVDCVRKLGNVKVRRSFLFVLSRVLTWGAKPGSAVMVLMR